MTAGPGIAIAYHSGWGHTTTLAEAVADGARQSGATATVLAVDALTEAPWAVLDDASADQVHGPTCSPAANWASASPR
ncbi:flavodoxin domain-containing protein [Amycolatopsis sp.]|jgi:multimeric flavodoxin WrbA|uniref:flavodoxin domain-containing protein n=1 Tax=Amycolatopsis sp. TaxID=37632 RepID=UPI002E0A9A65|nr:flavodoxin domain-containing protein [Amycolatopsis sp.]